MTDTTICLFCTLFEWIPGEPDWSDVTPGVETKIGCGRGIWEVDFLYMTTTAFRQAMITAKTCEHFVCVELGGG